MVINRGFRRWFIATVLYAPAAFSALFETTGSDLAAAVATARAGNKQLAVMFEQADCGYCEQMKRTVLRDAATETAIGRRFHTVRMILADPAGPATSTPARSDRQAPGWWRASARTSFHRSAISPA